MKTAKININDALSREGARTITVTLISAIFIFLFIYTASDKLYNITEFSRFIGKLAFLNFAPEFVAWSIPLTEIIISILLLYPPGRAKGMIASALLMSAFTVYLIYMKFTAEHLPCHCGGAISRLSWAEHIWFNLILLFLAIVGIYLQSKNTRGR